MTQESEILLNKIEKLITQETETVHNIIERNY